VGMGWNLRGVLLDTKGPEIRTGSFEGGAKSVELQPGASVILSTDPQWATKGTSERVRPRVSGACGPFSGLS
jgi:pyruvate kinase